jgi:aminoglycoside phosphotransferase (APT) family kinase protein
MTLTEGANGYCLHRSLREQGGEVADILGWVQAVGRAIGPLPQADLVHLDFHHRNLLRTADGGLTVVDMEGCQPGDRAFDLVTFCFGMSHAEAPVGVEEPLWLRAIELTSSENVRAYVAHMALRLLDWTIRLHPAPELHRLLPVVRRFIDRVQDS